MDWRLLPVVALVVLSGCNTGVFGGQSASGPETDVTPVPVETTEPTATRNAPELGFYNGDEIDTSALRDVHQLALGDRSYTWVLTDVRTHRNTRTNDTRFFRRVAVDEGGYTVTQRGLGFGNDTLYVAAGTGYRRSETDGDTSVRRVPDPPRADAFAFTEFAIGRFLTGLEFDHRVVERNGQRYHSLYTAPGHPPPDLEPDPMSGRQVWNYTATVYVTDSGLVSTMVVSYWQESPREIERVSIRFEYRAVGGTDVIRPQWVPETPARNQTADRTTDPGTQQALPRIG